MAAFLRSASWDSPVIHNHPLFHLPPLLTNISDFLKPKTLKKLKIIYQKQKLKYSNWRISKLLDLWYFNTPPPPLCGSHGWIILPAWSPIACEPVYFLCLIESFVPQLGHISRRVQVMFKIGKVQKMFFKVRTIGSNLLLR